MIKHLLDEFLTTSDVRRAQVAPVTETVPTALTTEITAGSASTQTIAVLAAPPSVITSTNIPGLTTASVPAPVQIDELGSDGSWPGKVQTQRELMAWVNLATHTASSLPTVGTPNRSYLSPGGPSRAHTNQPCY